jgi:hypothetical protein
MSCIYRINRLSKAEKEGLYRILIPPSIFHRFNISPFSLCNDKGRKVVHFFSPYGDRTCLVEVKLPGTEDPLYSIQLTDSVDHTQIDWDFVIVNDPESPMFNTHIDHEGRDTLFGWASRNIEEEERAMAFGLFPGQIRKGLGLTLEIIHVLEFFCRIFDIKTIRLEALFYHNAITYERYGFGYLSEYKQMKRINELFQPGEKLYKKLNNKTPFRKPDSAHTVRGRSWSIHDGILNEIKDDCFPEGWISPMMYRMVGQPREMITFPDPVDTSPTE